MLFRSLALAAGLFSSSVDAFWRLPCNAPLIVERADPIVSPGRVAGHVHTISGASGLGLSATFEGMRASECMSCLVKQDMSAYWTPALYFHWANGSFTPVKQVGGGLIYYLPRAHSTDTTKVQAFPDGLRILTGNPFLRSYNSSSLTAQAIGWNCLGAGGTTRNPYLPTNNCPSGLRGEVRFPSCWDGKNIDSADHSSHMAYPKDNESGPCPTSHPVRIVTLFYEMMWDVDAWNGLRSQAKNPQQPFVTAQGDATGYGYHGDFLDGWDKQVLQTAIDTCTSDSGVIEYCKVFNLYSPSDTCRKTPDVNEVVTGTLTKLPGCNPVTYGPANAAPCADTDGAVVISNPVTYTGNAPPPGSPVLSSQPSVVTSYKTWSYVDCYSDLTTGARALATGLATANKTIEACLDACAARGFSKCGVQYHGECWGSNVLDSSSSALGFGKCGLTCSDNPLQYCGGSQPTAFEYYTRDSTASMTSSASVTRVSSATSTTQAVASTTLVATTTASPSLSAAPAPLPVTGKLTTDPNWTYSGCNSDLVNSFRSLPNTLANPASTIPACLASCAARGYAVCALSYGGECYGGPALSVDSKRIAADKCAMSCNGDRTTTCGGGGALDVYLSTKVKVLTQPTTPNLATFGKWSYKACHADLVNNVRTLPVGLTNSNNTIEACLSACTKANSKLCGLSYYGECWSSTSATISSSSAVLDSSRCKMPCRGNPLEYCGGSAALSVYTLSTTTTTTTTAARRQPRAVKSKLSEQAKREVKKMGRRGWRI